MRSETAAYKCVGIGPGGRDCACCAPIPQILKRLEHRKARREERKVIEQAIRELKE